MTPEQRLHEDYKRLLYLQHVGQVTKEQVDEAFKKWCDAERGAR